MAPTGGERRSGSVWRHVISVALAALCLWLALRGVDLKKVGAVLGGASLALVLAAGAATVAMNLIKCTKIGILLGKTPRPRYRTLFCAESISILVDVAFPFRLLELVKAYVIGKLERIPAPRVLGAEVVEKGMELVVLLSVLLALVLTQPLPPWMTRVLASGFAGIALLAGVLVLLTRRPQVADRPLAALGRVRLPGASWLADAGGRLVEGMRVAAVRPRALATVFGITLVEWVLLSSALWLAAAAVHVQLTVPELLAVLVANFVAFAVPASTAGSIGIYEFAGKTVLVVVFAMDPEPALALVVVFHAVMVGFGALLGVVGLPLARISLAEVRGASVPDESVAAGPAAGRVD